MVSSIDHGLGTGLFDFLDDGGIIHRTRRNAFIKHHFDILGRCCEFSGILGEAFAVIALVMENGDRFDFQPVHGKIHFQFRLGVIGGDRPEEVGILAALGQFRIGRRGGHDDDPGIVINSQGRLGGAAADMPHHNIHFFGNQFCGRVGRHFGFAGIVLDQQFNFFAQDTAPGVDILDHQFSGFHRGEAVRGQIAAVRSGNAQLDRVSGQPGTRQSKGNKKRQPS